LARLFADENFPLPVVEDLRILGHDVVTTHEAGMAETGVSDTDILTHGASEGRAVLTLNRKHFIQLHRQRPEHPGIVVCTSDRDFTAQARRIHLVLCTETDLSNRLIRVNRPGPDAQQSSDATIPS
jgi:Domain of unknown function (DUF5615)